MGGKGKGKRTRAAPQLRKELSGVLGQVLGDSAGGGKGKGKGKRKGKASAPVSKPSRRAKRKRERQEAKSRRAHFFGQGRQKDGACGETNLNDAKTAGPNRALRGASSGKTGPPPKKQKRSRAVDDEDITSDEGGGDVEGDGGDDVEGDDEEEGEEEEEASTERSEGVQENEGEGEEATRPRPGQRGGSVGSSGGGSGYVPPYLRRAANGASADLATVPTEVLAQRRLLRGTMNRVTEGNLDPTGRDMVAALDKLVSECGAASTASSLMDVLLPAAVGDANISVLVLGCYAALATAAHVLFGLRFGAAAVLGAGSWLTKHLSASEASGDATGVDARIGKNCIIFLALLFSFGLIGGGVIFDLVRFVFTGQISEVRIELALTTLRYAGRRLRTECAEDFKEVLKFVTDTAMAVRGKDDSNDNSEIRTRVDFLLRELADLKNNKVSFAVMDRFEVTRTWLTSTPLLAKKKVSDVQLTLPFRFLAEGPPEGWLGGESSGQVSAPRAVRKTSSTGGGASVDSLRELAIAHRLSTELRQSLFVALMGAEDVSDATDRLALVAAGAKAGADEACLVIVHCAVRERVPNPFYAHVAEALCSRPAPWGKRYQHSMKRAAVQNLQLVHTYGLRATVALAELIAALVSLSEVAVPLAVVRFIRFEAVGGSSGSMGGILGLFLRHLLESILQRSVDSTMVTEKFAALRKYDDVREGLLLVIDAHIKPRCKLKGQDFAEKFRAARKELALRATAL